MSARTLFVLLMCAQAAHSIEESVFKLYAVFAPARALATVISADPRTGFAIGNIVLVTVGFACYLLIVRPMRPSAIAWMWGWAALEAANGCGHILMALTRGTYFPGVATAPVLLAVSLILGKRLLESKDE